MVSKDEENGTKESLDERKAEHTTKDKDKQQEVREDVTSLMDFKVEFISIRYILSTRNCWVNGRRMKHIPGIIHHLGPIVLCCTYLLYPLAYYSKALNVSYNGRKSGDERAVMID